MRLMTDDEKLEITLKSIELEEEGKFEEAEALMKQVPMPAYAAKTIKDSFGTEFLLGMGFNLSEAEAEYGKDWLK